MTVDIDSGNERILAALPLVERIIGFIRRRNRLSVEESEDFASYVRLKLVERGPSIFGRFVGRSKLETYLAVVVQRLFLDFRRERRRRWEPPLAGSEAAEASDPVAAEEDRAAAARMGVALRQAIARLPEQDRVIVTLHFFEGMSLASVAAILALRQKPLYRRVERILDALREGLESAGIAAAEARGLIGRPELGVGWDKLVADMRGNATGEPSNQG